MAERKEYPVISFLRGGLVVSCQAEGDDPFNSPHSMALFAQAAEMGGACGIRARDAANIRAICQAVSLPVIGITKGTYPDGTVLITPAMEDVEAVVAAGARVVAVDATMRKRPGNMSGTDFVREIKRNMDIPLMADVATLEEGIAAAQSGADLISTTLSGYTAYTRERSPNEPDWDLLERLVGATSLPVVMEGRVWSPAEARRALDLGAFAVVVGTAITRPRVVTQKFVAALRQS